MRSGKRRFSIRPTAQPLLRAQANQSARAKRPETSLCSGKGGARHRGTEPRIAVPLSYARVDVIGDGSGKPALLELELAEPSLFFRHRPDAAQEFAQLLLASYESHNESGGLSRRWEHAKQELLEWLASRVAEPCLRTTYTPDDQRGLSVAGKPCNLFLDQTQRQLVAIDLRIHGTSTVTDALEPGSITGILVRAKSRTPPGDVSVPSSARICTPTLTAGCSRLEMAAVPLLVILTGTCSDRPSAATVGADSATISIAICSRLSASGRAGATGAATGAATGVVSDEAAAGSPLLSPYKHQGQGNGCAEYETVNLFHDFPLRQMS